jgi:hypothetical protein
MNSLARYIGAAEGRLDVVDLLSMAYGRDLRDVVEEQLEKAESVIFVLKNVGVNAAALSKEYRAMFVVCGGEMVSKRTNRRRLAEVDDHMVAALARATYAAGCGCRIVTRDQYRNAGLLAEELREYEFCTYVDGVAKPGRMRYVNAWVRGLAAKLLGARQCADGKTECVLCGEIGRGCPNCEVCRQCKQL